MRHGRQLNVAGRFACLKAEMKTQTETETHSSTRSSNRKPTLPRGSRSPAVLRNVVRRWWFWTLIIVLTAVVVVHVFLAIWVRDYVNRKLSEIPGYRAHVTAVTLHLWRGAYQIHNIDIKKTSGKVPVPFFSAPLVDLSVQWHALIFEGSAVGNIEIHRGKLNIVNGPTSETRQVEVDAPWAQKIKQLFPLKINRFAVQNGEL